MDDVSVSIGEEPEDRPGSASSATPVENGAVVTRNDPLIELLQQWLREIEEREAAMTPEEREAENAFWEEEERREKDEREMWVTVLTKDLEEVVALVEQDRGASSVTTRLTSAIKAVRDRA